MKFNRIEIDNFMAVGEVTIDVDSKGLVLIQGENHDDSSQDSNGAGKSTIVEALQWGLFNETARGDSGDDVINRKVGKNCRVLIQIVDGDREYNIIRHRKHKDHKNRVLLLDVTDRDDVVDLTSGTDKTTQEQIAKIIGCSSDVFRAAIYSGQESQIDLPNLTDKHLKSIVEEAAGIDKMQLAHQIARSDYSDAKSLVTTAQNAHEINVNLMSAANDRVDSLRGKAGKFEADTAFQLSQSEDRAIEFAKLAKRLAAEVKAIDVAALRASLADASARIKGVTDESKILNEFSASVTEAKNKLSTAVNGFERAKKQAKNVNVGLKNVMSEIGTDCESCGQEISESSIESRRSSIETNLKSKISDAKELGISIKGLEAKLLESQAKLSEYESSMTDVSSEITRQRMIQNELDAYNSKLSKANASIKDAKQAKEKIIEISSTPNPFNALIKEESVEISHLGEKIDQSNEKIKRLKAELQTAGCIVDVFSPSGIRAHILDTVTPFLNDRTAKYLGTLSDGNIQAVWSTQSLTAKGEVREKFAIEVSSSTGGGSYRSLSGGEKRKVRLASTLALQDLVSSRASKPIELWIGDEIDDAVDASGLERLMTVLEEKAKEKGTVLIISHNQLSDWVRQHTTVVKKDGLSTMTGVLNIDRSEELV